MKCFRCLCLMGLFIFLNTQIIQAFTRQSLVLATSSASSLPALTLQEVRKVFLGVQLQKGGEHPVPLLNMSDPLIFEVFLQNVAFMSANVYESQSLFAVFRLGGKRPEKFDDLKTLVSTLQQNPGTMTFLWEDQVRANQGIKTVNVYYGKVL